MDWGLIASVASAAAALVAIVTTAKQAQQAMQTGTLINSASVLIALEREYIIERRAGRVRLARTLLALREANARAGEPVAGLTDAGLHDQPILSWFENIAYLTRRGVLDRGMVWNKFFWDLEHYYLALTHPVDLLALARQGSKCPTLYQALEWLYWALRSLDEAERQKPMTAPGVRPRRVQDDEITAHLRREAALDALTLDVPPPQAPASMSRPSASPPSRGPNDQADDEVGGQRPGTLA